MNEFCRQCLITEHDGQIILKREMNLITVRHSLTKHTILTIAGSSVKLN